MPNAMNARAPDAPAAARRGPRLVPTVATLVAVALFVGAGNWQRGRMHTKEALRAQYDAVTGAPPIPFAELPAGSDWTALRYRPVSVTGEFDPAHQILIDNRIHAGRPGFHVVALMRLATGGAVLVDRGWVALAGSRASLPSVPAPAGSVTVVGRINLADHYIELKNEAPAGVLWQNLDPVRFAAATGVAVPPIVVEQTASLGPDDTLVRAWPAPDFGVDRHWMYMWQWYAFATMAVVLWVVLNFFRRPKVKTDG
jgi:cytochrome oxidase assembly protein ShyY1